MTRAVRLNFYIYIAKNAPGKINHIPDSLGVGGRGFAHEFFLV